MTKHGASQYRVASWEKSESWTKHTKNGRKARTNSNRAFVLKMGHLKAIKWHWLPFHSLKILLKRQFENLLAFWTQKTLKDCQCHDHAVATEDEIYVRKPDARIPIIEFGYWKDVRISSDKKIKKLENSRWTELLANFMVRKFQWGIFKIRFKALDVQNIRFVHSTKQGI